MSDKIWGTGEGRNDLTIETLPLHLTLKRYNALRIRCGFVVVVFLVYLNYPTHTYLLGEKTQVLVCLSFLVPFLSYDYLMEPVMVLNK